MGSALKMTPEVMEEILERLADGEPLSVICRSSDRLPARQKVHEWRAQDPDFAAKFKDAKDCGRDSIAWNSRKIAKGEAGFSTGDVLRDRLIIDTNLKLLAAWDGRYNQKVQHVGSDGEGPIRTETELIITFVQADGSAHSTMEAGGMRSAIEGPKLIQGAIGAQFEGDTSRAREGIDEGPPSDEPHDQLRQGGRRAPTEADRG